MARFLNPATGSWEELKPAPKKESRKPRGYVPGYKPPKSKKTEPRVPEIPVHTLPSGSGRGVTEELKKPKKLELSVTRPQQVQPPPQMIQTPTYGGTGRSTQPPPQQKTKPQAVEGERMEALAQTYQTPQQGGGMMINPQIGDLPLWQVGANALSPYIQQAGEGLSNYADKFEQTYGYALPFVDKTPQSESLAQAQATGQTPVPPGYEPGELPQLPVYVKQEPTPPQDTNMVPLPKLVKTGNPYEETSPFVDMTVPGQPPTRPLQESPGSTLINIAWDEWGFSENTEGRQWALDFQEQFGYWPWDGPGSPEENLGRNLASWYGDDVTTTQEVLPEEVYTEVPLEMYAGGGFGGGFGGFGWGGGGGYGGYGGGGQQLPPWYYTGQARGV